MSPPPFTGGLREFIRVCEKDAAALWASPMSGDEAPEHWIPGGRGRRLVLCLLAPVTSHFTATLAQFFYVFPSSVHARQHRPFEEAAQDEFLRNVCAN